MEKIWKLAKVVAFIISLIAFVYVGQIISQKGRYQSSIQNAAVLIIDTQTGTVQYFSEEGGEKVFHKINFKDHSFE